MGFKYDPHYPSIYGILSPRMKNGQIEAIFIKDSYEAILYKIVCKIDGILWLAIIEHTDGREYLIEF